MFPGEKNDQRTREDKNLLHRHYVDSLATPFCCISSRWSLSPCATNVISPPQRIKSMEFSNGPTGGKVLGVFWDVCRNKKTFPNFGEFIENTQYLYLSGNLDLKSERYQSENRFENHHPSWKILARQTWLRIFPQVLGSFCSDLKNLWNRHVRFF